MTVTLYAALHTEAGEHVAFARVPIAYRGAGEVTLTWVALRATSIDTVAFAGLWDHPERGRCVAQGEVTFCRDDISAVILSGDVVQARLRIGPSDLGRAHKPAPSLPGAPRVKQRA